MLAGQVGRLTLDGDSDNDEFVAKMERSAEMHGENGRGVGEWGMN